MKKLTLCLAVAALLLPAAHAEDSKSAGTMTEDQKTLYAVGQQIGRSLAQFALSKEDLALVEAGMHDTVLGATPKVDLSVYGPKIQQLAQARRAVKAESEKAKGKAFLEAAAKEPGAVKTASGLVYTDLKVGTGASPNANDKVRVHYKGTLISGEEFDSSYKRNEPAEFPLNGVIACWTEGVQKMKEGGKARFVCPAAIAYGEMGNAGIPPGATLVFEVELLKVTKSK